MSQLFRQLADRLVDIAATQEITVSHGPGDPDDAAAIALEALDRCDEVAHDLDAALRYAQTALSPLGVRIPADDTRARPDTGIGDGDDTSGVA